MRDTRADGLLHVRDVSGLYVIESDGR